MRGSSPSWLFTVAFAPNAIAIKIKPAINAVTLPEDNKLRNALNLEFVDNVATKNVQLTIDRILNESDVLVEMQKNGEIMILGAMYNVNTGVVTFHE